MPQEANHGEQSTALEQRKTVISFDALVDALQQQLVVPDFDAQWKFSYPEQLAGIRLQNDAQPIDAKIRTSRGPIMVSTDTDFAKQLLQQRDDAAQPLRLTEDSPLSDVVLVYALTEAKIRALEQSNPDSPALRGFQASRALQNIKDNMAFITSRGWWQKGYDPRRRRAMVATSETLAVVILAACGIQVATGTNEPPQPAPQSTVSAEATPTNIAIETGVPYPTEIRAQDLPQNIGGSVVERIDAVAPGARTTVEGFYEWMVSYVNQSRPEGEKLNWGDFEFLREYTEGKGWSEVLYHRPTGHAFVLTVDGVPDHGLNPILYLDQTVSFGEQTSSGRFGLFEVPMNPSLNPVVVRLATGWNILVGYQENIPTEWFNADTRMVVPVIQPEASPTTEAEPVPEWAEALRTADPNVQAAIGDAPWSEMEQGFVRRDAQGNIVKRFLFDTNEWVRVTNVIDGDKTDVRVGTTLTEDEIAYWRDHQNELGIPMVDSNIRKQEELAVADYLEAVLIENGFQPNEKTTLQWIDRNGNIVTSTVDLSLPIHIIYSFGPEGFDPVGLFSQPIDMSSWENTTHWQTDGFSAPIEGGSISMPRIFFRITVQGESLCINDVTFGWNNSGDREGNALGQTNKLQMLLYIVGRTLQKGSLLGIAERQGSVLTQPEYDFRQRHSDNSSYFNW